MFHVMKVADVLVRHIKKVFAEDIAIVAYYGSYAQGTATSRSDLDFFFIPLNSKGYNASIQFVLHGISFDFWPISWERAEKMACYEDSKTSIIADSIVLYSRSENDLNRFRQLKQTIITCPQEGLPFLERAEAKIGEAYVYLHKMNQHVNSEDLTFHRHQAYGVLTTILYSIALINRTYLVKGWGKNTEQIMNFSLLPDRLDTLIHTIMHSISCETIHSACEELTARTLQLLKEQLNEYTSPPAYPTRMKGFYEEIKGTLDKVRTACETNDYETAFFGAIHVQDLISNFLFYAENGFWPSTLDPSLEYQSVYKESGLPNIVSILDNKEMSELNKAIEDLDSSLRSLLLSKGVHIHEFRSIEQLEKYLSEQE
ncbi:nucleotidyltransferase domain-containing protein [Paenibacillus sp. 1001270B_150601_E10]|uniref:nucleotidyltransferase domain-containing protein n=1 Tax=Paenibacillus sp. 1001270B_150601_E10 TaxID=2787079 RepID=UPI001E288CCE|nr:nucleotidyltransferase domain-containing protein [Paenibacillus sp. 1001270B_150601_E10]